jgi:hypothetical protein
MSDQTPNGSAPGNTGNLGEPGSAGVGGTGGTGGTGGSGAIGETGPKGEPGQRGERGRRGGLSTEGWLVVTIACVIIVGLGVGGWLYQRENDKRNEVADQQRTCLNLWASDFTATVKVRADGNADLQAAQARKNAADDSVTDVFVEAFLTEPRPPDDVLEQHFTTALQEYAAAKTNLQTVSATVALTQASNPYPELDLNCKTKPK